MTNNSHCSPNLTTVHSPYVSLKLLRSIEFATTKITNGPGAIRIGHTAIGSMHIQIADAQEELVAELALVGTLAVVFLGRVLHDVVLTQYGFAANLAVVFAYCKTHCGIMEDGTVGAIVQRMIEFQITATAI